jgi:O-succinylhomoserine sulfhydrylase
MTQSPKDWRPQTRLVRGGMARSPYGEISEALYLTQSFAYDSAAAADRRFSGEDAGFIYQRFGNPTTQMFEERLALLEGAEVCRATASGMSAVHVALQGLVRAGDHVVAGRALFGSCRWILSQWMPRFGVEVTFVDATDPAAWADAIRPNTRAFLVESPANPLLEVTPIAEVAALARQAGARLVVDNVFATPVFQKPLELGADIVVYSATKHIDGQGRVLGGADGRGLPRHPAAYGPGPVALQLLGAAEGAGDPRPARAPTGGQCGAGVRRLGQSHRRSPGGVPGAA